VKPRIAIVLAVVSLSAATIVCSRQAEISEELGRAHAAAFRDRQSGEPLAVGQEKHELLGTPAALPDQPAPLTDGDLRLRSCSTESVAVVRILGRRSFLTDDSSFAYTVYRATLLRVIKPSDAVRPSMEAVTFARPGGSVVSSDGSRSVRLDSFPSLQAGREYILALTARSSVLVAQNEQMQFEIVGDRAQTLAEGDTPADRPNAAASGLEQRLTMLSRGPCSAGVVVF
jgi:hypothetical protein